MFLNFKQFATFITAGAIVAAGFVATGCKKDDDSPSVPGTEAEIVAKLAGTSSKKWLPVNDVDFDDQLNVKVGTLEECEKDDTTTFYTDKKLMSTTGNNPCTDEEKNQHDETIYAVAVSNGIATMTMGGLIGGIITELSDSKLKIEMTGADAKKATLEMKAAN